MAGEAEFRCLQHRHRRAFPPVLRRVRVVSRAGGGGEGEAQEGGVDGDEGFSGKIERSEGVHRRSRLISQAYR
jgi:hypothetical protein